MRATGDDAAAERIIGEHGGGDSGVLRIEII